jgi:hypothetical protein
VYPQLNSKQAIAICLNFIAILRSTYDKEMLALLFSPACLPACLPLPSTHVHASVQKMHNLFAKVVERQMNKWHMNE